MKLKDYTPDYSVDIRPLPSQEGGGYLATFPQLGLVATGLGSTREEALKELLRGVPGLIETLIEFNDQLPPPEGQAHWRDYNGRVTLRLPKMLHYQLDRYADQEGVSLNTLMTTILQSGITAMSAGCLFGAIAGLNTVQAQERPGEDVLQSLRFEYDALSQSIAELKGILVSPDDSGIFVSAQPAVTPEKKPRQISDDWEIFENAG